MGEARSAASAASRSTPDSRGISITPSTAVDIGASPTRTATGAKAQPAATRAGSRDTRANGDRGLHPLPGGEAARGYGGRSPERARRSTTDMQAVRFGAFARVLPGEPGADPGAGCGAARRPDARAVGGVLDLRRRTLRSSASGLRAAMRREAVRAIASRGCGGARGEAGGSPARGSASSARGREQLRQHPLGEARRTSRQGCVGCSRVAFIGSPILKVARVELNARPFAFPGDRRASWYLLSWRFDDEEGPYSQTQHLRRSRGARARQAETVRRASRGGAAPRHDARGRETAWGRPPEAAPAQSAAGLRDRHPAPTRARRATAGRGSCSASAPAVVSGEGSRSIPRTRRT